MDISNISSLTDYYTSVTGEAGATELARSLSGKAENASTDDELMDVCKNLVDYFRSQSIQELASQSTEKQGLGIAQQLYEQLRRNYGLDENSIPADQVVNLKPAK